MKHPIVIVGAWFSADVIRLWLVNHKSKHRMPNWLPNWVFVGVVSVASAGCLFAVLYENERPKTFAVSAPVIIGSPSREVLPEYWLVTQEAAYAAPLAMQLEFANLKPISSMVSAYSIETKIGRKWVTMPCLDVRRGNVFWVPGHVDFVHAKLIDFRPMFNDLIQNKNLQPGDTAKGWLLISIPKEGWNPKSLQCRIKYSSGEEAVEPVIGPDPGGFDTDLRGGAIIAGPTKDISTIPKKYREDRYSPS